MTLVNAAMNLCIEQGYERTTVDQIAAAADVSARTFSRYFATKEAVFLTILGDYAETVAQKLETIPVSVGPLEALRSAHVAVMAEASALPFAGRHTNERVVMMLRVIIASDALRQAAMDYTHDPSLELLAERMGLQLGDHKVRLVSSIFSTTMLIACGDLIADEKDVALSSDAMIDRLNEACAHLVEFTSDLSVAPLTGTATSVTPLLVPTPIVAPQLAPPLIVAPLIAVIA